MVCQIGFNFLAGVSELKWQIGLIRSDEALITCDSSSDFMVVCPGRIQLNRRKARALGHIDYKVAQKSTRALVIYDKSRKVNTTLRLMFSLCNILRIRRVASHSLKSKKICLNWYIFHKRQLRIQDRNTFGIGS